MLSKSAELEFAHLQSESMRLVSQINEINIQSAEAAAASAAASAAAGLGLSQFGAGYGFS